jgi:hypothetical protein
MCFNNVLGFHAFLSLNFSPLFILSGCHFVLFLREVSPGTLMFWSLLWSHRPRLTQFLDSIIGYVGMEYVAVISNSVCTSTTFLE